MQTGGGLWRVLWQRGKIQHNLWYMGAYRDDDDDDDDVICKLENLNTQQSRRV